MTSDAELVGEGKSWKRFAIIPNIEGQMVSGFILFEPYLNF